VKISVITATWNCVGTVTDCLASVAAQTWPHLEHVVIDGASRDGTVDRLNAHHDQLAVLVSEPDRGIYDALNKGIILASGDVVGFLHADDVYASPDVLAQVAAAFVDPAVCAVYGDLQYVRKEDTMQVVRHWQSSTFTPRRLSWGWMPPHPTLYVRREWYQRIGGFDTRYRISADYLSILQLFSQPGFKAVYLPEVLVKMRLGGASNKSLKNLLRKSSEDWRALQSTGAGSLGSAGALLWKNLSKLGQFTKRHG
jgi:glycosyltransferase involved in cell wall biosynthesis